jgi:hypothetical protein
MKSRKSDPFYFTKEAKIAFKKLKKRFQLISILRLYDSKFSIRFEINISEFAIEIIISQLFPTENNKRKKIISDYILIAKINERGKKLRRSRYKILNHNRNIQKMAILLRRNSIYN